MATIRTTAHQLGLPVRLGPQRAEEIVQELHADLQSLFQVNDVDQGIAAEWTKILSTCREWHRPYRRTQVRRWAMGGGKITHATGNDFWARYPGCDCRFLSEGHHCGGPVPRDD